MLTIYYPSQSDLISEVAWTPKADAIYKQRKKRWQSTEDTKTFLIPAPVGRNRVKVGTGMQVNYVYFYTLITFISCSTL